MPTPAWSDEFTCSSGTYETVDTAKWRVQDNAWSPNNLAAYTPRLKNVRVTPWNYLELSAYPEVWTPPPGGGDTRNYTTGRIESIPTFTTGRFEARIGMPADKAKGAWPSFWMRGVGNWPACGEIDMMEAPYMAPIAPFVSVAAHGADPSGRDQPWNIIHDVQPDYLTGWHTYRVDRSTSGLVFAIDGLVVASMPRWQGAPAAIFEAPMYLVLGLGVGGPWPGPPDNTGNVWPLVQRVDYVRVY